jgi:rare lipoprotein A
MTVVILMGSIFAVNAQDAIKKVANGSKGVASYYHSKFDGQKTATGETFKNTNYTAACNNLKLGTYIKVTNLRNGKVVYVKVNDRMAAGNKRVVDLTSTAAETLHFKSQGTTQVVVEVVTEAEGRNAILAQREVDGTAQPKNTL